MLRAQYVENSCVEMLFSNNVYCNFDLKLVTAVADERIMIICFSVLLFSFFYCIVLYCSLLSFLPLANKVDVTVC